MARALLLTIVLAAGIAGCGGGGGDAAEVPRPEPPPVETTPAKPPSSSGGEQAEPEAEAPSAAEYRRRGNRLCARGKKRIDAVDAPGSPDDLASYLEEVLAIGDEAIAPIKSLEPPEALAERHEEAVDLLDDEFEVLRGVVRDIEAGKDPAETFVTAQPRLESVIDDENAAWRDLGLTECVDEDIGAAPPEQTPI